MKNTSNFYDIKRIQKIQTNIVAVVDEICCQNGIIYYLDFGSLLGAVRHKGFIPWDDDMDISMPRDDFEKFAIIAQKKLPDYLFYQTEWNDKGHYSPIARIRDTRTNAYTEAHVLSGTEHNGIYIDIFALDDVQSVNSYKLKWQDKFYRYFLGRLIVYQRQSWKGCKSVRTKIKKILIMPLKNVDFRTIRLNGFKKYNHKGFSCYMSFGSPYHYMRQVVSKDTYGIPVRMEFDGHYFNCPADYDHLLTTLYGDYMTPPKEQDRVNHSFHIISLGDFEV